MAKSPSAWQVDRWATSRVWTAQCVGWQLSSSNQGKQMKTSLFAFHLLEVRRPSASHVRASVTAETNVGQR